LSGAFGGKLSPWAEPEWSRPHPLLAGFRPATPLSATGLSADDVVGLQFPIAVVGGAPF